MLDVLADAALNGLRHESLKVLVRGLPRLGVVRGNGPRPALPDAGGGWRSRLWLHSRCFGAPLLVWRGGEKAAASLPGMDRCTRSRVRPAPVTRQGRDARHHAVTQHRGLPSSAIATCPGVRRQRRWHRPGERRRPAHARREIVQGSRSSSSVRERRANGAEQGPTASPRGRVRGPSPPIGPTEGPRRRRCLEIHDHGP